MKKTKYTLALLLLFIAFYNLLQAQEYNFGSTVYYYRLPNDSLVSSGLYLDLFNYNSASRTNDSLFTDGIYFPASDCFGRNLWIRLRHIAEDPNGTNRGINISATANSPCPFGDKMLGGWAGFLYDFEIHRDNLVTGNRANRLGVLYPTSITVASLETLSGSCGGAEWLSFMIVNSGSTGWNLNSINFTGNNPNSNPGFSDTLAVYTTGGCTPPDGFSYTFPTGADSISFISASCCGYSEFKMSAGSLSHFQYGYEYSGGSGGYQGMSMAFGAPPTFTAANAQNVTCKDGSDGAITVNITGGVGPFTYQWNDSTVTGNSLANLKAGTYHLTVTDQNGCGTLADTTIVITEPLSVSVNLSSYNTTNESCYGQSDASATVTATGIGTLHYLWSNGDSVSTISNLAVGYYTVTVSDTSSCLVHSTVVVQPIAIDTSLSLSSNTISAHQLGATYQWLSCADNSVVADSTDISFTPALTGDYKVAITRDGCTDTSTCVSISIVSGINAMQSNFNISIRPNPANDNVSIAANEPGTEVSIFNMLGEKIIDIKPIDKVLNLSIHQFPSGIYQVYIKTEKGTVAQRLVKD